MIKKLLCILLFYGCQTFAQEKPGRPFFTGSINISLGINENYVLFEPDDEEYFLDFTGVFLRTGFGYQIQKRFAISLNAGYDYHSRYGVSAIPAYVSLQYNIYERDDNAFFITTSYGKMWRPNNKYTDGNYYNFGLGNQIAGDNRWNFLLKLDYHRKRVLGFKNNRIDSFSIGFGFSFF